MKKLVWMAICLLVGMNASAEEKEMLGNWKTVDDKTGKITSVVNIYQDNNGKYYGKIVQILDGPEDVVCEACKDTEHNQPILGMVIVRDMVEADNELVAGKILDPDSGKFYFAKLSLKDGKLIVRGSLDKRGVLGRSQTWVR